MDHNTDPNCNYFCVHESIEKKQNDIIKEFQKTIDDLKKDKSSE